MIRTIDIPEEIDLELRERVEAFKVLNSALTVEELIVFIVASTIKKGVAV